MRKSDRAKWLIVIPAMLGIVLVTYVDRITDIWGFGAFICQLIAILELAYGMRIAMLAQSRNNSYRLTPEERHEYAQYLYEKQSILLFFCAQSQVCSSAPSVFCFPGGCCL